MLLKIASVIPLATVVHIAAFTVWFNVFHWVCFLAHQNSFSAGAVAALVATSLGELASIKFKAWRAEVAARKPEVQA